MAQLWALRSFGETVICSTLAQSVCLRDQTQQICCCPVQSLSCWQHMDLSTGSQDQPASNLIPTLLESFWRNTHHIELRVHVLRKNVPWMHQKMMYNAAKKRKNIVSLMKRILCKPWWLGLQKQELTSLCRSGTCVEPIFRRNSSHP